MPKTGINGPERLYWRHGLERQIEDMALNACTKDMALNFKLKKMMALNSKNERRL